MTRARTAGLALALATAALMAPTVAGGQGESVFLFALGGGTLVSTRSIPVRFAGQLTVSFHGDAASGCASRGLCGYSGTESWRPPPTGTLDVIEYRVGGRLHDEVGLTPQSTGVFGPLGGTNTAGVALSAPASRCLDAVASGESVALPLRHGRVTFTLSGATPAVLETRCAGPLATDITPYLPAPQLALGAVLRGHARVGLAASRGFAAHGFAGTIDSTLSIALGRPGRPVPGQTPVPRGIKTERYRRLTVTYRASVHGAVNELVSGDPDPAICAELGSCGVAGRLTLRPSAPRGTAVITVSAPASKPYGELLAAARGRAGGLAPGGEVTWTGGVVSSDLGVGSARCLDSAPLGPGAVIVESVRGSLDAAYLGGLTGLGPRTRCPGPGDDATLLLASGRIPRRELARKTIRLTLTTGTSFADDGYQVRTVPDLTLTLTRVRAHTSESTEPAGL